MTGFQNLSSALRKRQSNANSSEAEKKRSAQQASDEPATVKAAKAISRKVFRHPLSASQKGRAGSAAHYLFGTFGGVAYNTLSRKLPLAEAGHGTLFGAGLWAIADETLVPASGLSKAPTQYPLSTHAYGLASHLVFGLAADTAIRIGRKLL
jgi:hypothetical protein